MPLKLDQWMLLLFSVAKKKLKDRWTDGAACKEKEVGVLCMYCVLCIANLNRVCGNVEIGTGTKLAKLEVLGSLLKFIQSVTLNPRFFLLCPFTCCVCEPNRHPVAYQRPAL